MVQWYQFRLLLGEKVELQGKVANFRGKRIKLETLVNFKQADMENFAKSSILYGLIQVP